MLTNKIKKMMIISLVAIGAILILMPFLFPPKNKPEDMIFGATYSTLFAEELGLDPIKPLEVAFKELNLKRVRIPIYWNKIEPSQGKFDFTQTDKIMDLADKYNAEIILAIGKRVPRWPECFAPNWEKQLTTEEQTRAELEMLKEVVNRYKTRSSLIRWQIENEPYLNAFGECPQIQKDFLKKAVLQTKTLDQAHKIQTTASGELSSWKTESKQVDILGISVYRRTYTPNIGYTTYPIPPWFYRMKEAIAKPEKLAISELQAEPWMKAPFYEFTPEEQLEVFSPERFRSHIKYAQKIGTDEALLWGIEWWYNLKESGHPEMWNEAKKLYAEKE